MINVRDAAQGKTLPLPDPQAGKLITLYPSRFSYADNLFIQTSRRKTAMPIMPPPTIKLENGTHLLRSVSVKTGTGKYGEQEEVTCILADATMTRIWIPHNSRNRIEAAAEAGLVDLNKDTEEWHVKVNAVFQAVVVGGKVLTLLPYNPTPPAPAQVPAS